MSDFILSCCSTADLSREYLVEREISYVCFHFNLDGKDYEDDLGVTMPISEFYKKMSEGAEPTTSQVSVGQYTAYFEDLLKTGKPVVHITLSSGISGSYNSAVIARNDIVENNPDAKLFVVDSLAASSGYGLLMALAADERDKGASAEDVVKFVEENRLRVHHWFFSTDLTSYVRGGRVSAAAGWFGTILHICPLLNVSNEGKLIPRTKCRGKKKVMEEMLSKMVQFADNGADYDGKCFMSNSDCIEDAREVAAMIEEKFPKLKGRVMINNIGTVIGSHTGPGTVALFFTGDKRID